MLEGRERLEGGAGVGRDPERLGERELMLGVHPWRDVESEGEAGRKKPSREIEHHEADSEQDEPHQEYPSDGVLVELQTPANRPFRIFEGSREPNKSSHPRLSEPAN